MRVPDISIQLWWIDRGLAGSYSETMHINLTADQEVQLSLIAAQEGKGADELAHEVFIRGLAAEAHFISAVKLGQDAACRGDFVEQAEIWADVERILQL